jgi:hypothetical protein
MERLDLDPPTRGSEGIDQALLVRVEFLGNGEAGVPARRNERVTLVYWCTQNRNLHRARRIPRGRHVLVHQPLLANHPGQNCAADPYRAAQARFPRIIAVS